MNILCRDNEIEKLDKIIKSEKVELVVIVGRRRVGKTFLVRQYFKEYIVFEFTGIYQ